MNETIVQSNHIKTIREILGMEPEEFALSASPSQGGPTVPEELPVQPEVEPKTEPAEKPSERVQAGIKPRLWQRDWIRYPLIFVISFGLFYATLNFSALTSQLAAWFAPAEENEREISLQAGSDYDKWVKKYYVYVSSDAVTHPDNDPDGDGLNNLDEFYLGTNPTRYDTDSDGYSDGAEIRNGYNPLYEGRLTPAQEEIMRDKLSPYFARVAGSLDESVGETRFVVDTSREGLVEIPKFSVSAPLVWNKNFELVQDDLEHGVVHHPATVYPGERGLSSIHGHSSGYPWDGNYKYVFTKLNLLEPGDEVFVTVYNPDGESRRYRYVVKSKQVFAPDDPAQFTAPGEGYFLNLSTSWPLGTAQKRYVVATELAGF